jgi:hypothetical protein|tara:strand:+ start:60 stop:437 length:378 start_codon:yes stop_codon:yes gene_type:complete
MFFKLTNRNPYRDLVRNARTVVISKLTDKEKAVELRSLYSLLKSRLKENETQLNQHPTFSKSVIFWNNVDMASIRPLKTSKNPWLNFKRSLETALSGPDDLLATAVSKELGWFYSTHRAEDWLVQ